MSHLALSKIAPGVFLATSVCAPRSYLVGQELEERLGDCFSLIHTKPGKRFFFIILDLFFFFLLLENKKKDYKLYNKAITKLILTAPHVVCMCALKGSSITINIFFHVMYKLLCGCCC